MSAQDARDAHAALLEDGQLITITRSTEGAYNPATGAATVTTSTQTGVGCVFPYSPGLRNQPGSLIAENDQQLLLSTLNSAGATLNPVPTVNDRITLVDGTAHTIEAVQTLSPAGIDIMHDCRIRGPA